MKLHCFFIQRRVLSGFRGQSSCFMCGCQNMDQLRGQAVTGIMCMFPNRKVAGHFLENDLPRIVPTPFHVPDHRVGVQISVSLLRWTHTTSTSIAILGMTMVGKW